MQFLPRPSPSDPLIEWARYYASYGLAVIPVRAGTKQPTVAWKQFQTRLPTDEELTRWFGTSTIKELGIAMVTGEVSGNVIGLDIDLREFSDDLLAKATGLLSQTWTDVSGSGKLHIFLRSVDPMGSSAIKTSDGRLVMDICGDRHIIVLPPSGHYSGGNYGIIYNGPELIAKQAGVAQFAQALYDAWAGVGRVAVTGAPPASANMRVLAAPAAPVVAALQRRLSGLAAKARAAIYQSDRWFETYYQKSPRHTLEDARSEVQFSIMNYLIPAGWGLDDIEQVFAAFPCGDLTYNQRNRPHHGRSILEQDFDSIMKELTKAEETAGDLDGVNFTILSVHELDYGEDPHYDVRVFSWVNKRTRDISLVWDEIVVERKLLNKISTRLGIVAKLPPGLTKAGYERFLMRFMAISQPGNVPEAVKVFGHLRAMIRSVLTRSGAITLFPNADGATPTADGQFRVAWADEHTIYVRSLTLIHELTMMLRPTPPPSKIWDALAEINAEAVHYSYDDGSTEELWRISRSSMRM